MTNEELAELVQEGNDGLIPQLWEQVQVYVRRKAETAMRSIPPEHGVEVDDLAQSGYFALLEAVATFDRGKGTFLCWLEKYLKTEFAVAGGYRTSRRDPLNLSTSIDQPVSSVFPVSSDDSDGETFAETIPDETDSYADIEEQIYMEQLHAALDSAVDGLPSTQREVIRGRYWQGKSLRNLSEELGVSIEGIRRREKAALSELRKPRVANSLSEFLDDRTDFYRGGLRQFKTSHTSSVETAVLHRESLVKKWYADNGIPGSPDFR